MVVLIVLAARLPGPVHLDDQHLAEDADRNRSPRRPCWIPNPIVWKAFPDALTKMNFPLALRNTLIYAVPAVIGTVVSCSLVAYGFALVQWPGRNVVFLIVLATMMLPSQVTLIPLYVIYAKLGWINTYLPLLVPTFLGTPFFIFLLRQFFLGIPKELIGCGAPRRRERAAHPRHDRGAAVRAGPDHGRDPDVHRQVERLLRAADLPPEARAPAAVAAPSRSSRSQHKTDWPLLMAASVAHRRAARDPLFRRPAQVHRGNHPHRDEGLRGGRTLAIGPTHSALPRPFKRGGDHRCERDWSGWRWRACCSPPPAAFDRDTRTRDRGTRASAAATAAPRHGGARRPSPSPPLLLGRRGRGQGDGEDHRGLERRAPRRSRSGASAATSRPRRSPRPWPAAPRRTW